MHTYLYKQIRDIFKYIGGSQSNINTLYSSVVLANKTRAKGTADVISRNPPFKGTVHFKGYKKIYRLKFCQFSILLLLLVTAKEKLHLNIIIFNTDKH